MPVDKNIPALKSRFRYLADKIERLIEDEGLGDEVEFSTDQYNNTMKVYYETTEIWDANTGRWRVWDEDEDRWVDDPPKEDLPKIVKWPIYAHANKDSMYELALAAGLTTDEISDNPDILYMGYEIRGTATFNRETGEITEEWHR